MRLPNIVGIAGTNGSGKDTLGVLLERERDYVNISLSDVLRAELDELGLPHTRENLSARSAQHRATGGDGAMMDLALDRFQVEDRGICITSVRTPGEAEALQSAGGTMVWVDADQRIRYDRVVNGARGRGATDEISFQEFQAQDAAEMTPSEQGNGLNAAAVRDRADVFVTNEFASLEAYEQYLREFFQL